MPEPAPAPEAHARQTDVAFALVAAAVFPDRARLVAAAAERGLELVFQPPQEDDAENTMAFAGDELTVLVTLVPQPHPDAEALAHGATSPDPSEAAAAPAHYIVGVFGRPTPSARAADVRLAKALAAVVCASPCVGAMFGCGRVLHRPQLFEDVGREHSAAQLPLQVCVDMTLVHEPNGMLSVLSHGLARYGREELLVFAQATQWQDACNFTWTAAGWMLAEPTKLFPTGDTIGRTPAECVPIERGPSPVDASQTVVVLRLPAAPTR